MKTNEEIRQAIPLMTADDDVMLYENPSYCEAFIGIAEDNRAVYSYEKMVDCLAEEFSHEDYYKGKDINDAYMDAAEFIDYNIFGFGYDKAPYPIVMFEAPY